MGEGGAAAEGGPAEGAPRWDRLARRIETSRNRSPLNLMAPIGIATIAMQRYVRSFNSTAWTFFGTVLSLGVAWCVSVLLHEVGHAVAARLVGLRPWGVLCGSGPVVLRRRIGDLAVDLRLLPGNGLTLLSGHGRLIKWRLLATYAAGPLVTFALLYAAAIEPRAAGGLLPLGRETQEPSAHRDADVFWRLLHARASR
jgi:peptidase M50-like protein